jgi:hypothetical protein
VGKPWNTVYSDICRSSRRRYTGQQLRDAVSYLVERDVQMNDGQPFDMNGDKITSDFSSVWVHPETGILMRSATQKRPRYTHVRQFKQIDIDQLHKFVLINGHWFEVTFVVLPAAPVAVTPAPVASATVSDPAAPETVAPETVRPFPGQPGAKIAPLPTDILLGLAAVRVHARTFKEEWGAEIYAVSKRQASKREIKRLIKPHFLN